MKFISSAKINSKDSKIREEGKVEDRPNNNIKQKETLYSTKKIKKNPHL